ncbi:MAG TPA: protein kinase [Gemmatimonadaceae bacterium]|nr:protein kinase [Gemmatimonadaceae bacterium]
MEGDIDQLTASLADRYRIERVLGAGGMATVYLAHDLKHDRRVAIKVLRNELAAVIGADRFLSEIKTTANLQHPHILSLFDSGAVDGTVFYVMPYVEGESLRDQLAREKQLPLEDALRIGREVADALQYAHAHGVIHRDIKPENILLQGGHALVADFGIALAASKVGGNRMTETGMSLGTPQYMSPEQAMGERELDARTDIYALGCVMFEMLAGEPPFTGPTAQAIVAKVVTAPAPSVRSKRDTVPAYVDDAIRVALQKTPADRFRSAAEFAAALGAAGATTGRVVASAPEAPRTKSLVAIAVIVALIALAAFLLGGRTLGGRGAPPLVFGRASHVTWDPGLEITPALSPDGRFVAYAAGSIMRTHVMVRPVGEGRAVALTGDTTAAETDPEWSADGSRVLFLSRDGVYSAPAGGGPARPEVPGEPALRIASAAWAPDGDRIAFTRNDSLFVRESGATVRAVARITEPVRCAWAPSGELIACAAGDPYYAAAGSLFNNHSPCWIVVARARDGAISTITDSLSLNHSPTWSADGKWLYFVSNRDGPTDIYGVPISADGHAHGPIARLSTGLGAQTISLSATGSRLAYSKYASRSSMWSIAIPPNPPVTSAGATRIANANENIESMNISADGKWLFYDSDLAGNSDIFRLPLAGGDPEQLTTERADDFAPDPSPDGREVVFHSWRDGQSRDLYAMRLDGGGVQRVTNTPTLQEALAHWSPDGNALVYANLTTAMGLYISRRDATGHWSQKQLRKRGFFPIWSPDGRTIAFTPEVRSVSIRAISVDSGIERPLFDGQHEIHWMTWAKDGLIYFTDQDAHGDASIYSLSLAGGAPRLLVRFDPLLHSSFRAALTVGNGRIYFSSESRESDVWVMEVKRP